MAKRPSLIPLPSVLTRVLKSHGMEGRMREYLLQQYWTEIVGDHMAHHTWPDSIRHNKLYLLVENSTWMQQLLYLKPELLSKINAAAEGEPLTDIVFRIGPVATQASADHSDRETAAQIQEGECQLLSGDLRGAIESSVHPVSDPILRERLRALLTKSLQAGRKEP
jgi:hypothetical protein